MRKIGGHESHLMTLQDVADELLVDPTTVRRWVKSGALEAVTLPAPKGARRQSYRVHRDTLKNLLEPAQPATTL